MSSMISVWRRLGTSGAIWAGIGLVGLSLAGCEPDPEICWELSGGLSPVTTDTLTVHHLESSVSADGTQVLFTTDFFETELTSPSGEKRGFMLVDLPVPGEARTPGPDPYEVGAVGVQLSELILDDGTPEFDTDFFAVRDKLTPAWHPDGQRFAGIVGNSSAFTRLFVFTLDFTAPAGSPPRIPTSNTQLIDDGRLENGSFYSTPAFSPSGEWLAFAYHFYLDDPLLGVASDQQAIYAFNMNDSRVVQITPKGSVVDRPSWSPDGSRIVFESNFSGDLEVWRINFDPDAGAPVDASLRQLTSTSGSAEDPVPVQSFQPTYLSSGRIVFVSNRRAPCTSQRIRNLWSMNGDGGDQQLLFRSRFDDHFPTVAGTGNRILFSTLKNLVDDFEGQKTDLWLIEGF